MNIAEATLKTKSENILNIDENSLIKKLATLRNKASKPHLKLQKCLNRK
jgi:hypothetical protein